MTGVRREVALDVDAPSEQVWDLVSDVTRMGEWSPEALGADWLSGNPGEVGARFRGRNRRGRARWATTCTVLAAERGQEFAFAVGKVSSPDTVWRYVLTPLPDGRTRVQESYELVRPLSRVARLVTRLTLGVANREDDLEHGMRSTLQGLAAATRRTGAAPLR